MLARFRRNPLVTEKPLKVASLGTIEAETNVGGRHEAHEVGPHRSMHMKHKIEALASEFTPGIEITAQATGLVDYNELDTFESREERVLDLSNDPCELRVWPSGLDCADDRNRVARISDRGKPNDAEITYREIERR